jgi:phosphatidylglycerol---prolipoprotein diacylglyceryl transferase
MFPTVSHIINYFLGTNLNFPVQTFGFFEVIAFIAAYVVFKSEFKRKEQLGRIRSFTKLTVIGKPASILELLFNSFIGFVIGFKLIGVVLSHRIFAFDPAKYIFSLKGSVIGGLLFCGIFFYLTYFGKKNVQLAEPTTYEKVIHPFQLMPTFVFWCAFMGFIGAQLFCCLENRDNFIYSPWRQLFSMDGWTFYGGLIFGSATFLFIGYRRGMKLIDLADIGSPGMMLAYAVGRMGCHLSGDGDWGIVNSYPKPFLLDWTPDWLWSFKYPHNVLNAGTPIHDCSGNYCNELLQGVFPTSLYESLICLVLFFVLWGIRNRLTIPGLLFYVYLVFNGLERFIIELIKVNHPYYWGKFAITQAELIGLCLVLGGIAGLVSVLLKRKRHLFVSG